MPKQEKTFIKPKNIKELHALSKIDLRTITKLFIELVNLRTIYVYQKNEETSENILCRCSDAIDHRLKHLGKLFIETN